MNVRESMGTRRPVCRAAVNGTLDIRIVTREYNALGQVSNIWHADDPSSPTHTSISYDERGMPDVLYWENESQTLARVRRNVAGRIVERTNAETQTLSGAQGAIWIYDEVGRVCDHHVVVDETTTMARQELDYHNTGDVQHVDQTANFGSWGFDYFYDNRHQLIAATEATTGYQGDWAYTDGGRLAYTRIVAPGAAFATEREVTSDYGGSSDPEAVDNLLNLNASKFATYSYDEAGNVIERDPDPGSPGTEHSFVYDGDNHQREATTANGREIYFYDHDGQRMLSVAKDPISGAVDRVRFWFGGTEIWYHGNNTVERAWSRHSLGQPVARIEPGAGPGGADEVEFLYHSTLSHLLVALDDQDNLAVGYVYGPFGAILDQTGSTGDHLRRFNGKDHDPQSDLFYYGARYYDPLAVGWTQADPLYRFVPDIALGDPRRMNLYAFTLNNPLRYVDPDGTEPIMDEGDGTPATAKGSPYFPRGTSKVKERSDGTLVVLEPGHQWRAGDWKVFNSLSPEEQDKQLSKPREDGEYLWAAVLGGMAGANFGGTRDNGPIERTAKGRGRDQQRLRQIAKHPNTSKADRGWIKQEMNQIKRGKRSRIRRPPGKELAHTKGREAAKGYDHVGSPSNLQDKDLHKMQHRIDDKGRLNPEQPRRE